MIYIDLTYYGDVNNRSVCQRRTGSSCYRNRVSFCGYISDKIKTMSLKCGYLTKSRSNCHNKMHSHERSL